MGLWIWRKSKNVRDPLTEKRKQVLWAKEEIKSPEFQKENAFQSPPKEWIDHRLEHLHETLSKNTVSSALALKGILGTIQLEPISDEESDFYQIISGDKKKFKPYYIAHTKIQTLALLDERHKSSNWLHWRRGWDSFSPVVPLLLRSRPPSLPFAMLTFLPLEAFGLASNPYGIMRFKSSCDSRDTNNEIRVYGGEGGIRTLGTKLGHSCLPELTCIFACKQLWQRIFYLYLLISISMYLYLFW